MNRDDRKLEGGFDEGARKKDHEYIRMPIGDDNESPPHHNVVTNKAEKESEKSNSTHPTSTATAP